MPKQKKVGIEVPKEVVEHLKDMVHNGETLMQAALEAGFELGYKEGNKSALEKLPEILDALIKTYIEGGVYTNLSPKQLLAELSDFVKVTGKIIIGKFINELKLDLNSQLMKGKIPDEYAQKD